MKKLTEVLEINSHSYKCFMRAFIGFSEFALIQIMLSFMFLWDPSSQMLLAMCI